MRTTLITVLAFLPGIFVAQDFDRAKLDSLFALIEKNEKGMGSLSIFKEGEEVYQNTIGYLDVANKVPANNESVYRIGSISKTFTATIIMQLVEEDKLNLDTKLAEFYPDLPQADSISMEHLLRHQSGLFNFTNADEYQDYMTEPRSHEQMLQMIKENGTVFEPGEQASYSNTNYVLLSYIAEKVDGKDFGNILEDRITNPLGLEKTHYGDSIETNKGEALSYKRLSHWSLQPETDMSIPTGAGAIVSSATELNEFYSALFNGELVESSSLNRMKQMEKGYGIGLFEFPFYQKVAYGHTGGIDGFQSNAAHFPNENLTVAYLANGVEMPVNDIMLGVLSIYFGKEYDLPEFKPPMEVALDQLEEYTGVYTSEGFPLDITISIKDSTLIGQATGQPSFPLEPYEEHKFRLTAAGIKMEFYPTENEMMFEQGGKKFELKRQD